MPALLSRHGAVSLEILKQRLICGRCGTYVGAVMPDENGQNGDGLGIVNVNSLDIRDTFDPAPPLHVYDGEDEARRRARRRKFWMKTTVIA